MGAGEGGQVFDVQMGKWGLGEESCALRREPQGHGTRRRCSGSQPSSDTYSHMTWSNLSELVRLPRLHQKGNGDRNPSS